MDFREKSDKANIYVRKYMTGSDRASQKKFEFEQSFLKKGKYSSPKNQIHRSKGLLSQIQSNMRMQPSSSMHRIQQRINTQSKYDLEPQDKSLPFPLQKTINKNLWQTKSGFSIQQRNREWKKQGYGEG